MATQYYCRHGLTLADTCDACEVEAAREYDRRYGPGVDEARKVITEAAVRRLTESQKEKFEL